MTQDDIAALLKKTRIDVAPETFVLIALSEENWRKILSNPELSPRMTTPFMIFKDGFEITLLLDETDFEKIRAGLENARVEKGFRLLTFDIPLDFTVYGFLAAVTKILAEAAVPVVALSSFSRDHLLIAQTNLAKALLALRNDVAEIC